MRYALIAIAMVLNIASPLANSQEMTFVSSATGGNCNNCIWVAAQGDITSNTPAAFQRYIEQHGKPHLIIFNSAGGSLVAGIDLGRLIRASGATTAIGETRSLQGDLSHFSETHPGICASACAFAFMGGVERWVGDNNRLGVHQFYSATPGDIQSDTVQKLVGLTLIHAIQMGIDPAVIVAASGTSSEQMYWFQKEELASLDLDTSKSSTMPWRLEPYKKGLVLTTTQQEGAKRSVNLTIYCRSENTRNYLLVSEESRFYAEQLKDRNLINFEGQYKNNPLLNIGNQKYSVEADDLEFQRISNGTFFVSIRLPQSVTENGQSNISFDPGLGRAYGPLISASLALPSRDWLNVISKNCI